MKRKVPCVFSGIWQAIMYLNRNGVHFCVFSEGPDLFKFHPKGVVEPMKPEQSVTFQKQFSGLTKITKPKTFDNTARQLKAIQAVIALKKNNMLQDSGIIPVKTALDTLKNATYTLQMPKQYTTLRQYIQQHPEELKDEFIAKCIHFLVKAMKFFSMFVNNYISISPSKILLADDKMLFSQIALEEEHAAYDPEHAGVSLNDAPVWSIALMLDQLYRGELRTGEFTPIPQVQNFRVNQFLNQVFIKHREFALDDISPFLNPVQSMLCQEHKQAVIKVNLKERKLYCSKCLKSEYYSVEVEQERCRSRMDETIAVFKEVDSKLNSLIKLTKGDDIIDTKTIKKMIDESIRELKEEYRNHASQFIQLSNCNPLDQQEELGKLSEQMEGYKEELIGRYQQNIKKEILGVFRNQLDK